jgi:cell division protein FtsB
MDEQDYKNLITVYQNKHTNLINQVIALESRELKYRQTIEMLSNNNNQLNEKILELEKKSPRPKKPAKPSDGGKF